MKNLKVILPFATAYILVSCEEETCNCFYVTYESNPLNNHVWTETYRSTWDVTCEDEKLDSSVYTDSSGEKWYTDTYIECD